MAFSPVFGLVHEKFDYGHLGDFLLSMALAIVGKAPGSPIVEASTLVYHELK